MRIYLDDDTIEDLLVRLLRAAGHEVHLPADWGMAGSHDPVQFATAIRLDSVLLSHNHDDFLELHELILAAGGHHHGVLMIRRDNDKSRDLTPRGIVSALNNIAASGIDLRDEFQILNAWR
jgi:predicted nuclease of predicted toxin-antitoxin system